MTVLIGNSAGTVLSETINLTPTAQGCRTQPVSTQCVFLLPLAGGSYLATLATHDQTGGKGNELSQGQNVPFTVVAGQNNSVGLTLNGIPHGISVASNALAVHGTQSGGFTLYGNSAQTFEADAVDADGNAIVGAGSPTYTIAKLTGVSGWTSTDPTAADPNAFTITAPGTNGSSATYTVAAAYSDGTCSLAGALCTTTFSIGNDVQTLFVANYDNDAGNGTVTAYAYPYTSAAFASNADAAYAYALAMNSAGLLAVGLGGASNEVHFQAPPAYADEGGSDYLSSSSAALNLPHALLFDAGGNLWVANRGTSGTGSNTVTEYAPPFNASTTPAVTLSNGVNAPYDLKFDASGNLYVANEGGNSILIFDAPIANGASPTATVTNGVSQPYALALDSSGDLYVANYGGDNVLIFRPNGNGALLATIPVGAWPVAIAVDRFDRLFVATTNGSTSNVQYFTGPYSNSSTPVATITAGVSAPYALALDGLDDLFVANAPNGQAGNVTEYAPPYTGAPIATIANGINNPQSLLLTHPSEVSMRLGPGTALVATAFTAACAGGTLVPASHSTGAPNGIAMTMHLVIPGPHRHRAGTRRHPKFVSPSTDGVLVQVYPHGASYAQANLIAQSAVDVSSGSAACGGHTGYPRTCTANVAIPPTGTTADDVVVYSYDAKPANGSFNGSHLLGYGVASNQSIVRGKNNALTVYLGGVIAGLSGNAAFTSLPADGSTHTLAIAIDPVDFGNNPITAGTNDPFANPITVAVSETGGSGHMKLSLDGGTPATQVTVAHSSDTVQLEYDGGGAIGYGAAVVLTAGQVASTGGATQALDVSALALSSANGDYSNGKLALKGNGDYAALSVGELNAPNGTTYSQTTSNCSAIEQTMPLAQSSASSASVAAIAGSFTATPSPSGCVIAVSDGTSSLRIEVSNTYSGALGSQQPTITEFTTAGVAEKGILVGPDGEMWFTECSGSQLVKMPATSHAPTMTAYDYPDTFGTPTPENIAVGPDGNIWWADCGPNATVGKMTTAGVGTAYQAAAAAPPTPAPKGIVAGPDGAMWFTAYNSNAIGRIASDGTVKEYSAGMTAGANPVGITLGPDGNLWFAEYGAANIGKITTAGAIAEFAIPSGHTPWGITVGPDGALWFAENSGNNEIGRIPTNATVSNPQITEYSTPGGYTFYLTAGPDGAMWATEQGAGKIARLNLAQLQPGTSDGVTEYDVPAGAGSNPFGISSGPDGAIWFTECSGNNVGRIAIQTSSSLRRATAVRRSPRR